MEIGWNQHSHKLSLSLTQWKSYDIYGCLYTFTFSHLSTQSIPEKARNVYNSGCTAVDIYGNRNKIQSFKFYCQTKKAIRNVNYNRSSDCVG